MLFTRLFVCRPRSGRSSAEKLRYPPLRTGESFIPAVIVRIIAGEKAVFRCAACSDYPCSLSEALEKRFRIRYDIDLSANNEEIRCAGAEEFLRMQKEEFTCPVCKGVISIQDQECSICQMAK